MAEVKNNVLELTSVVTKLNVVLNENIKNLNSGASAVENYNKKFSTIPSEYQKALVDIKTKTDNVSNSNKKLEKTSRQLEQQSIKESNARNALNKQREKAIVEMAKENSAYLQLSKAEAQAARTLQDLIAKGRTADQTQKQYNATLKVAQNNFDQLRAKLIMADTATQRFNRNVGNYKSAFSGMAGGIRQLMSAFGVMGGIFMFAQVMRSAFKTIKDFDKANADLAATMGKTRAQITALTNDQKRLGATTKFTATEVAGLQKEFAKLGFSEKEILNSTEATLALASAVDTDLANAAMVAGSTLRGFGLDASEMGRVTDIMAMSFTKSALDIDNFKESMKYVAPIASATGVSIEFTTAMLGKLADAGIKGSQAGTSLRRILAEMAKTGLPTAQAFDKVAKSGISVKDAMDEVGRTAQTSLLVLSKSKDGVNELAKAFEYAGGSAQKMADEQLNSLEGQLTLLSSAWDGLILSFNNGDGVISKSLSGLVSLLTEVVAGFTLMNETTAETQKRMNKSLFDHASLAETNMLNNEINTLLEERASILKELDLLESKLSIDQNNEKIKRNIEATKVQISVIDQLIDKEKEQSKVLAASFKTDITKRIIELKEQVNVLSVRNKEIKYSLEFDTLSVAKQRELNFEYSKNIKSINKLNESLSYKNGELQAVNKIINKNNTSTKKNSELVDDNSKTLNKNTKETKDNAKAKQDVRFALLGSVEWFEKLKSSLETEQKQLSTNSKKWQEYKVKIDQVEKSIKAITDATKELEGVNIDINDTADVTDAEGDKLIQAGKDFRLMLKEFQQSFITDFADNSGFGKMLDILNGGLDKFEGDAKSTALAVSEAFQEAFNTIAQASQANFDAEYSRLEAQRDFSISFAGDSATAKEEIERQYNERKKAIQRREAEAQKRLAIFNAIIDTAQAVVAALPNYGLAIAVGIIGAAQIALISSQPVPQFYKGTDNAPEGWALTQERGAEVITDKKGNVKTLGNNKGAQMTYLNKGDKVYKSHDDYINKQLSKNGIQEMGSYLNLQPKVEVNNSFDMDGMKQEFSKLAKVISNKEGVNISIDENGFNKRKGNTSYINSRLTLKSQQV